MHGSYESNEDPSELLFLLFENYAFDRSCWSHDRQGIFGNLKQKPFDASSRLLRGFELIGIVRSSCGWAMITVEAMSSPIFAALRFIRSACAVGST